MRVFPVAVTLVVAACGSGRARPETAAAPAAGPAIANVSLADVGLEATSLDRRVAPCDDFYQYACGGWIAANEIPSDQPSYSRFTEIEDRNDRALRAILDELIARPAAGEVEQKLADFYGSCLDEAAVEKRGLAGLAPLLGPVDKVKDVNTLQAALIALHRHGIPAVWATPVHFDLDELARTIVYVQAGGLGLPERSYYLDDDFAPARAAYEQHLARLFGLLGKGAAAPGLAADVLALETTLARLIPARAAPGVDIYHPTDLAGLAAAAPAVDWPAYFAALGNPDPGRISVMDPPLVDGISAVMRATPPAVWRAYLTARVVGASPLALPRALDAEVFTLARAITGVETPPPRWRRCVDATAEAMPEYLGQLFVARHFAGDSKAIVTELADAVVEAMKAQIDVLPWMTARAHNRRVLDGTRRLIGYPDTWGTYTFSTSRTDLAGNLLAAGAFAVERRLATAGQPFDRARWLMPAFFASAYHSSAVHTFAVPAGLLQVPFFGRERSIAVNLGGIGMAIGHELSHGFADEASGGGRGRCVARQYGTYEPLPGAYIDGVRTLNENVADLGGIKFAFLAYRALRAGATTVEVADGLTEDQQFFVALGQVWCSEERPEEMRRLLVDDHHAPPRWRVNGTVRNLPEFAAAFGCTRGQPMAPAETCTIW